MILHQPRSPTRPPLWRPRPSSRSHRAGIRPGNFRRSHLKAARAADRRRSTRPTTTTSSCPQAAAALKQQLIQQNPDLQELIIKTVDEKALALAPRRADLEKEAALAYAKGFPRRNSTRSPPSTSASRARSCWTTVRSSPARWSRPPRSGSAASRAIWRPKSARPSMRSWLRGNACAMLPRRTAPAPQRAQPADRRTEVPVFGAQSASWPKPGFAPGFSFSPAPP